MTISKNAICVFDFTLYLTGFKIEPDYDQEELRDQITPLVLSLRKYLDEHCKGYAFQLEECPTTGKEHFQGRVNFKTKTRTPPKSQDFTVSKLSPTSEENKGNMFYVKKEARLEGPWMDAQRQLEMNGPYIPRQVREIEELYPWQQTIVDSRDK